MAEARPELDRPSTARTDADSYQERKQKTKGTLAALGTGFGLLLLASTMLSFGAVLAIIWAVARGCG